MPFKVTLLDTSLPPFYQRIARKAPHLRELGLNFSAIARRLGVSAKTAAKGIAWLRQVPRRGEWQQHLL